MCYNTRMVLGYHVILTAYGFWLPNDPRGSWSDFVGSYELYQFGPATKVHTTRSVAHVPYDRAARLAAKQALQYEPVRFSGRQAVLIARGIGEVAAHWSLPIHACSILPDHAHLVIARTDREIGIVVNQLEGRASLQMSRAGMHPFQHVVGRRGKRPSPWAARGWAVYIDNTEYLRRAIAYVERNPVKHGFKPQGWSFVTAWEGPA